MSTSMDQTLLTSLKEREANGLYRSRRLLESQQGSKVVVDGRELLNFSSNDYLGLASHPEISRELSRAAAEVGLGSGASHLVNGHHQYHHQLEEALAEFTGRERALLFSTGYMANMGAIGALVGKGDLVLEDRLNHASLLDGGLLSGAKFQRFQHNDSRHLLSRLEQSSADRKLVAVDGVFSMDGDVADLHAMSSCCSDQNAWLMVDDAHGFGVLGERGAGCLEDANLNQQDVPILMATLGKAAGTFGAFVAGSHILIETLIQFARPYIYTTAMPPAVAAASLKSLELFEKEGWRRSHLNNLISDFVKGASQLQIPLLPSKTAIQPVLIGDERETLSIARHLEELGFLVGAIRPPTVPAGTARLRVTLSAAHSKEQVSQLLEALSTALKRQKLSLGKQYE